MNVKDEISLVPIWVQLKNLYLKFWGEKCLRKIVGSMGAFIHADRATLNRDKLLFARVQVETLLKQSLPEELKFHDGNGVLRVVTIGYEWKPIVCDHCKLFGHSSQDCKRIKGKKIWVEKRHAMGGNVVKHNVAKDNFVPVSRPMQVRTSPVAPVVISKTFQLLNHEGIQSNEGEHNDVDVESGDIVEMDAGGGKPPDIHG